jgi:hypothetical protein
MRAEDTFDGRERMMTKAAYDLQVRATAHSASCGHPGFVPHEYLTAFGTQTTVTAAVLCTVGMWERVDGGYRVLDWEAVEVCLNQLREIRSEDRVLYDPAYFKDLAGRMYGLVIMFSDRLPVDQARWLHYVVDVGEYGLALEDLVAMIDYDKIAVTDQERSDIAGLSHQMRLDLGSNWSNLTEEP